MPYNTPPQGAGQIDVGGAPLARRTMRLQLAPTAMSLRPQTDFAVPGQTARVARAAFPKGNAYLTARDGVGTLFHDADFADLYPDTGQPASAPWRLALVTVFQFAENLTDRQAADAVRARLDWKYALSLDLEDAGFDFSVLSEFRGRLLGGGAEERLLGPDARPVQGAGPVQSPRLAADGLDARARRRP